MPDLLDAPALDVAVVVIVLVAAVSGARRGGAVTAARTAGAVLGLGAGLAGAGLLSDSLSPVAHVVLGLICAVGGFLLGAAGGAVVGRVVRGVLPPGLRGLIDAVLGFVARGLVALVVCLFAAALAVSFGPDRWARAVRSSEVLGSDAWTPVSRAIDGVAPGDLAALVPAADVGTPGVATVTAVDRSVAGQVFAVTAAGCAAEVTGTAFVAGRGLVVTNAHVVRGASRVSVDTADGVLAATAVLIDRRTDLAVLQVQGLSADPLPVAATDAANGSPAVIVGYPEGRPRTAVAAAVLQRMPIPTPGLSDGLALHQAYRLDAPVRHGNSGSPLLDTSGQVIGVVNALAGRAGDRGYATTRSELVRDLARADSAGTAVSTGSCG